MKLVLFNLAVIAAWSAGPAAGFERVVGSSKVDRGIFVSPTRDGGYVAVGFTAGFGAGGEDVYLVRTDATGQVVWTQTYGGPGADNGWAVRETNDGFAVAGFTDSSGAGKIDCSLMKTDALGEALWTKTFGGSEDDHCWGLLAASDGGYVLVGETRSSGSGEEDCYLIKTDAAGTEKWSKTFGGEKADRCFSIAPTDDGGFLLAGQTFSEGAGDRDAYVIRTDASGTMLWSKTFGGAASDVAHSVARNGKGDFIVTGYTTSFANDDDDPYLIRIDANGQVLWTRVLAMPGLNHTLTGEETSAGGFVFGGFSEFKNSGARGALLIATDGEGNLQWKKDLFLTTTGSSFGYTVRATSDGGSILTGHTTEGSAGGIDLFLVKSGPGGQ